MIGGIDMGDKSPKKREQKKKKADKKTVVQAPSVTEINKSK
ncbi:MAG: hypothetical protein K0R69_2762 [Clostridia bacterium]|jgi:hypothetical protein|nr:hypothetical protein [Clostridia bacterium]